MHMADEAQTEGAQTEEAQMEGAQAAGAQAAGAADMGGMANMLAYTIRSPLRPNTGNAYIRIGQGPSAQLVTPSKPADYSYWIVILDGTNTNPATKVQEWVIPSTQNNVVPSNLDQYMTKAGYIFAVVTQALSGSQVPQGAFYDYLATYGAGRELQKLEQMSSHTQTGYGLFSFVSYILTGQCGPTANSVAYERSSVTDAALLLMSLMPLPSDQRPGWKPPFSICDSNTFVK
jgi:hypothetical protein